MDFDAKKDAALEELQAKGVWKQNSAPPLLQGLWKLGLKLRPPHYNTFGRNWLFNAVWFGPPWAVMMWVVLWRSQNMPVPIALFSALGAGLLFGVMMAGYYRWSARRNGLSQWDHLGGRTRSDA